MGIYDRKTQEGDWRDIIGVNLKFYIQDDPQRWDDENEDTYWLKLFGGGNQYWIYNGFNPQVSGDQGTPYEDLMDPAVIGSVYTHPDYDPYHEFNEWPDPASFNFCLGGAYCRLNTGEGEFLNNSKNNSAFYRRTILDNYSPYGNNILDVYGGGITWGTDSNKRFIQFNCRQFASGHGSIADDYESGARNGFITPISPNNYSKQSTLWFSSGVLQEEKSFNPYLAIEPEIWDPNAGGYEDIMYEKPSGFKGINFHAWVDVPSPFMLFGNNPELQTYSQDTVALFCLYNQYGRPSSSSGPGRARGNSQPGWNLLFAMVRDNTTDEVSLKLSVSKSRNGRGANTGVTPQYAGHVTLDYPTALKKIFSSSDTVASNSTKPGGLRNIQFQWLAHSNKPIVWIDGEMCEPTSTYDGTDRYITYSPAFGQDLATLGGIYNHFFFFSLPISDPSVTELDRFRLGNEDSDMDTRFIGHFTGKIYEFAAYGVPLSFKNTDNCMDSDDVMRRIYALGMGNIPRKAEYVDFSDQFEMNGKNLLESIGAIKQVIEGKSGQFFVQLNSVEVRNID